MSTSFDPLLQVPENLSFGEVQLRFVRVVPSDGSRGFVPYYHFRILNADDVDVGHINFRVGDSDHVRLFAGHIGFEVSEPFHGHGFAGQACRAIAPFVRSVYRSVRITCDPDNDASIRTIERLGAKFRDEIVVPPRAYNYQGETRRKRRYDWTPLV